MDRQTRKMLRLNGFTMNTVGHMAHGLWRYPGDRSTEYKTLRYWTDLAELLEKGLFDGIMLADSLGVYDVYTNSPDPAIRSAVHTPINDPLLHVSAMADHTSHLGFIMTANVTYEHPYLLARRMSTLDHLTDGRWGWNVVTGIQDSAARAMGQDAQIEHDRRYDMADEYMEVVYKLIEGSWADDAVVADKEAGIFADPGRVRTIDHRGEFYKVNSIHLCEPSRQRTPVLFQAGASSRGQDFAARHAECVLLGSGGGPAVVGEAVRKLRKRAADFGRDPYDVLVFISLMVVVAPTAAEARDKYEDYRSYWDPEGALAHLAGATGEDYARFGLDDPLPSGPTQRMHSVVESMKRLNSVPTRRSLMQSDTLGFQNHPVVGSPVEIADIFQRWVEEADIDGINLHRVVTHASYQDFIDLVVPELQDRGLFKTSYQEGSLREKFFGRGRPRLPASHPAARYRWA